MTLDDDITAVLAPSSTMLHERDPFGLREKSNKTPSQRNVPWRTRIHHFTWAWYLPVMGTGGVAAQLHMIPQNLRFRGLDTIGSIIFIISIILFIINTTALTIRFSLWKNTLYNSFRHPTEGLFTATFLLSIATILINTCNYGVPRVATAWNDWLLTAVVVCFWIYTLVAMCLAILLSYFIISHEAHTPQAATPAWALPCFPAMLVGSVGATVIQSSGGMVFNTDLHNRIFPILITSIVLQGFGILISLMFITMFLKRLMLFRLPSPNLRPAMFMTVGPPGFTSMAFINLGYNARFHINDNDFDADGLAVGRSIYIFFLMAGLLFYGLAAWWLLLSITSVITGAVGAHMSARRARKGGEPGKKVDFDFHLSWWAFLFPNTGFIGATMSLGTIMKSVPLQGVGVALVVIEVCIWLLLMVQTPLAVWRGRLLVPGKDEDADVEGYVRKEEEMRWNKKIKADA